MLARHLRRREEETDSKEEAEQKGGVRGRGGPLSAPWDSSAPGACLSWSQALRSAALLSRMGPVLGRKAASASWAPERPVPSLVHLLLLPKTTSSQRGLLGRHPSHPLSCPEVALQPGAKAKVGVRCSVECEFESLFLAKHCCRS